MEFKKINVIVICAFGATVLYMFIMWSQTNYTSMLAIEDIKKKGSIKFILQWTSANTQPFKFMGSGDSSFHSRNCPTKNCFITSNRKLLGNVTFFDAILFHGPEILYFNKKKKLRRRSNQSYIFVSQESASNYPATNGKFNGVFNFTWTYRLDSNISFYYLTVKDRKGRIIGPSKNISWINVNDMMPINDFVKEKLSHKSKAVAWFVSHCNTINKRENLAAVLAKKLEKHNMSVDIYGECGDKKCPRSAMRECVQMLQKDYYFYFSFENSMSEDYVTEKLNIALQNYAVPIVYGGANYNRFMPDGIYLDAGKVSPTDLVKQMVEIIQDKDKYYNFFKWHNHYSYHSSEEDPATDPYCLMCEFVNNINNISIIENFQEWWNPNNRTTIYYI